MSEPAGVIKLALSREFVVLRRRELEKTLRELEKATKYIKSLCGPEDCGFLVCQAQIRLLRELVAPKSVSREIDELIRRRLAELEGREYDAVEEADYEALKREYHRLVREADRLKKLLEKRGTRRKLLQLTRRILEEMGLERVGDRLREVSAEILRRWKDSKDDAHLYINLLELEKKKAEASRRLEEIRLKRKPE